MRTAFSNMAWKIGFNSPGDVLMMRNTSAEAFSRSSASSRSRRRRAVSLTARTVGALRRFGIALRLRALVGLLLALERRRIAHLKGLGLRRFSKWDYSRDLRLAKWGFGLQCTAVIRGWRCPLWVKSGHDAPQIQCPLYPQKRTLVERVGMSALCHKRTHALQQFSRYSITWLARPSSGSGMLTEGLGGFPNTGGGFDNAD